MGTMTVLPPLYKDVWEDTAATGYASLQHGQEFFEETAYLCNLDHEVRIFKKVNGAMAPVLEAYGVNLGNTTGMNA